MYVDSIAIEEELDELFIDAGDVVEGFKDRYGSYSMGNLETDPEMDGYSDAIELARALRRSRRG